MTRQHQEILNEIEKALLHPDMGDYGSVPMADLRAVLSLARRYAYWARNPASLEQYAGRYRVGSNVGFVTDWFHTQDEALDVAIEIEAITGRCQG